MRATLLALLPSLVFLLAAAAASAAEVRVQDAAGLVEALEGAAPGDEIVLEEGTYRLSGARCSAVGNADAPIVVRAASPLGAVIELDGAEGFRVSGAHWRFEGLDIRGVCVVQGDCEHAFHVTGAAHGFVLRSSKVRDFNAQLKVNAAQVGGVWVQPNDGLVELSEIFDTAPRQTSSPVTKLNIDSGSGWVVRDSYLHDFRKAGGNEISYGAFMKSGGEDGLFERNLVVCSTTGEPEGTRIGLSFGGGGTGAQFCAPAFDPEVPCSVEHHRGVLRNNIIAGCSDVGIYLNRAAETKVLFNTLIGTAGIDFRFDTTSGLAAGNVLAGRIENRDGGTHVADTNLEDVAGATFASWYRAPLEGDLALQGDVSELVGAAEAIDDVVDDYCARRRPAAPTLGALEHSLGDCATVPPPGPDHEAGEGGSGGAGGSTGTGGSDGAGGAGGSDDPGEGGGGGEAEPSFGERAAGEDASCGCAAGRGSLGDALLYLGLGVALLSRRGARRRRPT